MAKSNMKAREVKRAKIVKKYEKKRSELKSLIVNPKTNFEDKMKAVDALNALPKDSSKIRKRNRCLVCGRARAVYSKRFQLCRIHLRELVVFGNVPGVHKSSW